MSLLTGWLVEVDGDPATLSAPVQSVNDTVLAFTVTIGGLPIQEGQVVRIWYNDDNDGGTTNSEDDVGTINAVDGGTILANITNVAVTNSSTLEVPSITAAVVSANGTSVTLTLDRAVETPGWDGFSIDSGGDIVDITGLVVSGGGTTITLYVDAVYAGAATTLTYDPVYGSVVSTASDTALVAYSEVVTNNSTREAPTVTRAVVLSSGLTIELYLSERVTSSTPETGWTITNATRADTITIASATLINVNGVNDGIRLTLSEAIYTGDDVTLAYDSGPGDVVSYANALLPVVSFTGMHVVVSSGATLLALVPGSSGIAADGLSMTLTFNSTALSGSSSLGFTISVNGVAASFTGGGSLVSGVITRTLSTVIFTGDAVTVLYDETPGTLVAAERTMYSFGPTSITNASTQVPFDPGAVFVADVGWLYEPMRPTGAFQDLAMTVTATAEGETVGVIADLSGNGYHLSTRNTSTPFATVSPTGAGAQIDVLSGMSLALLTLNTSGCEYAMNPSTSVPAVSTTADFTRYMAVAFADTTGINLFPDFLHTRNDTGVSVTQHMLSLAAANGEIATMTARVGTQSTPPAYQQTFTLPLPKSRAILIREVTTGGVRTFSVAGTDYVWTYTPTFGPANLWYSGSGYHFCVQQGIGRALVFDMGIDRLLTTDEKNDIEAYLVSRYPFLELP